MALFRGLSLSAANTGAKYDNASIFSPEIPSPIQLYTIGLRIAGGSFNVEVFEATHRKTGQKVAMKRIDNVDDIEDYGHEVAIMKECSDCASIVKFYEAWHLEKKNRIYIAMEYCGGSVKEIMRELRNDKELSKWCNSVFMATVCAGVLEALKYLHAKGGRKYIHRDIKTANILVTEEGQCKLSDFGVSYIKRDTHDVAKTKRTGTWHWMAPEVLVKDDVESGQKSHDCSADIWSLGITVLEMLNPDATFFKQSENWLMTNIDDEQEIAKIIPEVDEKSPETITEASISFIHECLQQDPSQRPSATKLLTHKWIKAAKDWDDWLVENNQPTLMYTVMDQILPVLQKKRKAEALASMRRMSKQMEDDDLREARAILEAEIKRREQK